jgi:membrane protein
MEESVVNDIVSRISRRAQALYDWVDGRSGGLLSVFRQAIDRFAEIRGPEASASLAYYALFSLFPLTFLLVAVLGFLLESEEAFRQTVMFIRTIFPFSGDLVERNLTEVTEARGAIGAIGFLGAVWSASGFFNTLARNINRAWPSVKLRGLVQSRLVALGMVGALVALLLLSLISTTLLNLLPAFLRIIGGNPAVFEAAQQLAIVRLAPAVFTLLMFTGLYRWVPNKIVRWRAVIAGAGAATVAWELAKSAFTLFLRSGLARYEIVYGSLGTLIVLMVWIYLSSLITLLGAHLVASLDLRADHAGEAHVPALRSEPAAPRRTRG